MGSEGGLVMLTTEYRMEFEQGVEDIKRCLGGDLAAKVGEYQNRVMEIQPTVMQMKDQTVDALQDTSSMENVDTTNMMRCFSWATVMLFTMGLTYGLARYLLGPIVGIFLSPFMAFLAAAVVLPVGVFYYLSYPLEENKENDVKLRHQLLGFAAAEGLLTGALFSSVALSGWAPIAAVTTAVITVVLSNGMAFAGNDRQKFLGAALGGGLAFHLVWGILLGFSMPFFLLTILYTAAAFATIQLYIRNITKEKVFAHVYQALMVCLVVWVDLLVMGIFAGDAAEVGEASKEAAAAAEQ